MSDTIMKTKINYYTAGEFTGYIFDELGKGAGDLWIGYNKLDRYFKVM